MRCAIGESTLEELVVAHTKRRAPPRISAIEMPRGFGESVAHFEAFVRVWHSVRP